MNPKLRQYSALTAGVLLAGTKVAKSQIKYFDVDPDAVINQNQFIDIDLDQDGFSDLTLEQYYYYYYYYGYYSYYGGNQTYNTVWVSQHPQTKMVAHTIFPAGNAARLDQGIVVGGTSNFTTASAYTNLGSSTNGISNTNGAWSNGGPHFDKYLGVRLTKGSDSFYGWIRLDYNASSTQFTVKEFALNMEPNAPITTGQTVSAVDSTFSLQENPNIGDVVGTLAVTLDPGVMLSITAGNTGNAFTIDPATGELIVNDPTAIDFETNPVFQLTVNVSRGMESDDATVIVNLSDANDELPVINSQTFSVAENVGNGTVIDTVLASDPDVSSVLTYSITAGNTGNAFAIDPANGELTVNNSSVLNSVTTPTYSLTVEVDDGLNTASATVTINVTGPVSLAEFDVPEFTITPNPVIDNWFRVLISNQDAITLNILDLSGRLVETYENITEEITIQTDNYAKGTYLIQVIDAHKGVSIDKVVIR